MLVVELVVLTRRRCLARAAGRPQMQAVLLGSCAQSSRLPEKAGARVKLMRIRSAWDGVTAMHVATMTVRSATMDDNRSNGICIDVGGGVVYFFFWYVKNQNYKWILGVCCKKYGKEQCIAYLCTF